MKQLPFGASISSSGESSKLLWDVCGYVQNLTHNIPMVKPERGNNRLCISSRPTVMELKLMCSRNGAISVWEVMDI